MKKILFFMLTALLALPALARDFTYPYLGQTLVYTVLSEDDKTVEVSGDPNTLVGDIVIPSQVENGDETYRVIKIRNQGFDGCYMLLSVTIPEGVTEIGKYAFDYCDRLLSVTIPEGVTKIDEYAFRCCVSLSSVTIPESVTEIGKHAFYLCESLSSVTIPEGVTEISEYAFFECYSLSSVTIPEGVTKIGQLAFGFCKSLSSVTIPESVTEIGYEAFCYCESLLSVTIPEGVTEIGYGAFENCYKLESVILPASLTTLGNGLWSVWESCYAIKSVTCMGTEPVSAAQDLFTNTVYNEATLYVPKGCVDAYVKVVPWCYFTNIENESAGMENVTADNMTEEQNLPCEVYTLQGVKVAGTVTNLPAGLYIVRQGKVVKKITVK